MQTAFWKIFADQTDALEAAIRGNDAVLLSELVNELAACLARIDFRLNVNIGFQDPFRLAILSLPGAEHIAQSFIENAKVPTNWEFVAGIPEIDPVQSVRVEDEDGDMLSVKYADLDAKVLPPRDGLVTIVVSLDADFETSGPRAHLFQAVAENVVFTVLGGWPPELAKAVLLPRSRTGKLLPLMQLRQQWLDVVARE
jgi:hypothetical protein